MKEQVSVIGVDMAIGESNTVEGVYLPISEYKRLKRLDCENAALRNFLKYLYHKGKPNDVEFNFDELIRLKRLEENVKKLIKEYELELHEDEKYCKCTFIDLLKSLDK